MKAGDIVRLKQAFKPTFNGAEVYRFGIVVGLVASPLDDDERSHSIEAPELVLHLYNPEQKAIYTDELGVQALFTFRLDEVEPLENP